MKPNILFLFPDQWRGDWWSRGGRSIPVRTPAIDALAARGATFHSAISPAPLCGPARACLARGLAYPAEGVVNNRVDYPLEAPTIYRTLRDSGYHVTGCGKFDLHKPTYSWGEDGRNCLEEWGFSDGIDSEGKIDGVEAFKRGQAGPYLTFLSKRGKAHLHVEDFARRIPHGTFPTPLGPGEYCDDWITDNALKLLSASPEDKPWFLQVNFAGPHDPFDVTAEMHEWYRETDFEGPIAPGAEQTDHLELRRNYAAMIENIDRNISRILSHPRVASELDRTLIVFSSDHGEMLGDHGFFGKRTPHNGSVHVPFVAAGPGVRAGTRVDAPISLLDVSATFLEYAGLDAAGAPDSASLIGAFGGAEPSRSVVTSALHLPRHPEFCWRLALDKSFKFVRWHDGSVVLFDRRDYREEENLAGRFPAEAKRLEAVLPPFHKE